jgi:5S rRNA maturation endonuclease (ribonuclease M5)
LFLQVYVCDGTRVLKAHVRPELEMLQQLGRRLVVLTDPDERGRELRCHLDDIMGPLHHAFVPEQQGTSDSDGPVHAAGNRGIEHVVPVGVQQALAAAQPSWPRDRAVWGLEDLQRLQLANAFDAGHEGVVRGPGGAAARRRQLCALLGLGKCSAAQLLSTLNRFFSEDQLKAALQQLDSGASSVTP